MRKIISGLLLSIVCITGFAADIDAGKAKSTTCAACHGPQGIAMIPMYPHLAGQNEQYLVLQLKAFRDETRKNMLMTPMAKGLSDKDIDNLAAYYASLKAN